KILEEPPGSATLILTAPSPYSLLPTIVSRCLQFKFAPLATSEVESILKETSGLTPAAIRTAAQLAEGSPGYALDGCGKRVAAPSRGAENFGSGGTRGRIWPDFFPDCGPRQRQRSLF